MLNRYGPVLDANRVVPLGPERCRVDFDWWIEAERAGDRSFVERCVAASAAVQEEDVAICESVQRGMRTRSFVRGRYAPRFERALFHFHRRLAADLRAGD
jgi:choline monooxygenase